MQVRRRVKPLWMTEQVSDSDSEGEGELSEGESEGESECEGVRVSRDCVRPSRNNKSSVYNHFGF